MLWAASDKASRLKQADLYHTGVGDPKWSQDGKKLFLTLGGSIAEKSGEGIRLAVTYDLESHTIASSGGEGTPPGDHKPTD